MRLASLLAAVVLLAACGDNLTPNDQEYDSTGAPKSNGAQPGRDPYVAPEVQPLPCVPNLDGQIDAKEITVGLGLTVSYLVPPNGVKRTFDLAGSPIGSLRVWDWGQDFADDQVAKLGPSSLSGRWFAAHFPTGQFVSPVDLGGTVVAINRLDDKGLYLLGVASAEENPKEGKTLMVYSTPITALLFPIKPGGEWSSTGEVRNGFFKGIPYAGRDTYRGRVDGMGTLKLPDVTFQQVHRVRTDVTIVPAAGTTTTQKQVGFYFECFGEVARAQSQLNETVDDFTNPLETRRFGL